MSSKNPSPTTDQDDEDEEFGRRYSETNPPDIDMSDLTLPAGIPMYRG